MTMTREQCLSNLVRAAREMRDATRKTADKAPWARLDEALAALDDAAVAQLDQAARDLPPVNTSDREDLQGRAIVLAADYGVFEWNPEPAAAHAAPTQVHLVMNLPLGEQGHAPLRIVLRLKSARAADELIAVLLRHRKNVWP